jgi:hypothetical protein
VEQAKNGVACWLRPKSWTRTRQRVDCFCFEVSVPCIHSLSCWIYGFWSAFGVHVCSLAFYLADCITVAYLIFLLQYHQLNMSRFNKDRTTTTTTTTTITTVSLLDMSCRALGGCHCVMKFEPVKWFKNVLVNASIMPCSHAKKGGCLVHSTPSWMVEQMMVVPCGIHQYASTNVVIFAQL